MNIYLPNGFVSDVTFILIIKIGKNKDKLLLTVYSKHDLVAFQRAPSTEEHEEQLEGVARSWFESGHR